MNSPLKLSIRNLAREVVKTTEYISRDDALLHGEIIRVYSKDYGNIDVVPVEYLADIPAADVQPVIYAHWQRGEEKGFKTYNPLWYCSNCGERIRYDIRTRTYQKTKRPVWEVNAFCRKCGAKMIEERSGLDEDKR